MNASIHSLRNIRCISNLYALLVFHPTFEKFYRTICIKTINKK